MDRGGGAVVEVWQSLRSRVRLGGKLLASAVVLVWMVPVLTVVTPWALLGREAALAVGSCVSRIPDALDIVREERETVEAEQEAFARFAQQLDGLDTTTARPQATPNTGTRQLPATDDHSIDAVRDAYRDTVMDLPHYERAYGEQLQTNMRVEFGPEVTAALAEHRTLTPQLKELLLQASHQAREKRDSLLRHLDREHDHLSRASDDLAAIETRTRQVTQTIEDSPYPDPDRPDAAAELFTQYRRLEDCATECEAVHRSRQQQITRLHSRHDLSLHEYLYAEREWTFPLLGDALACLDRIDRAKRHLLAVVARLP